MLQTFGLTAPVNKPEEITTQLKKSLTIEQIQTREHPEIFSGSAVSEAVNNLCLNVTAKYTVLHNRYIYIYIFNNLGLLYIYIITWVYCIYI